MDRGGGVPPPEGQAPDDHPNPNVLHNETPTFLVQTASQMLSFLQSYGWFVVFGVIVIMFLIQKMRPHFEKMRQQREDAAHHKNVDSSKLMARQEAMAAARERMQQEHADKAARFAEEQKKKEEEKRQQKIEDWERHQDGRGYRSKNKPQDTPSTSTSPPKSKGKPVYRSADYNPLVGGGGGGSSYRPSRRGGASGGG